MIPHRFVFLSVAFFGVLYHNTRLTAQAYQSATIVIGGRTIEVPPPAGFVQCDGVNAEWDKVIRGFIPSSNWLLATFGTPEDLASLKAGKNPDYRRNFNVQIVRSLELQDIGERTFAGLREEARRDLEKMRNDVDRKLKEVSAAGSENLSRNFGVDAALTVYQCRVPRLL
jgi:hypothetical protein